MVTAHFFFPRFSRREAVTSSRACATVVALSSLSAQSLLPSIWHCVSFSLRRLSPLRSDGKRLIRACHQSLVRAGIVNELPLVVVVLLVEDANRFAVAVACDPDNHPRAS